MSSPKLYFILMLLCSSFSLMAKSKRNCGDQTCGSRNLAIRFPFRVNDSEPEKCGYPGFDVHCTGLDDTLLELPNSVFLNILSIFYDSQKIWLSDQHDCLPKKLLSLNLSYNSPFYAIEYQQYVVFNCSGVSQDGYFNGTYYSYELRGVDCLSGSNYTVYVVSIMWAVSLLSSSCQWVGNISAPADYDFLFDSLTLYWDEPRCGLCERIYRHSRVKANSVCGIECTSKLYPAIESTSGAISVPVGIVLPLFMVLAASFIVWLRYIKGGEMNQLERSP